MNTAGRKEVDSLTEIVAKIGDDFKILRSGNNAEIKLVKKRLQELRYGWGCMVKSSVVEIFLKGEIAQLSTLDNRHLKAVLESFTIFWIQSSTELRFLFLDLVLKYIQHQSGGVREAARHHAKNARLSSLRVRESGEEKYLGYLRTFAEAAQKERVGINIPIPLRSYDDVVDLAPSPYKSMCLAWEDLNMKNVHENWFTDQETLELGMPIGEEHSEYFGEEAVTIRDIKESLWKKGVVELALPALTRLEEGAKLRFENAVRLYNFPESEIAASCGLVQTLGPWDGGVMMFEHLIGRKMKDDGARFDALDYTSLFRASQGFSNNVVVRNAKSEPYTALIVGAILQREREGRNLPKNLPDFLTHCADAHDAVDQVIPLICALREKDIDEVKEREANMSPEMRARFGNDDFSSFLAHSLEKDKILYAELESIAHHALDWYIQVEPWGVERCSPKKLAARVFDALRDIHIEHGSTVFSHMPKSFFSQFGGWAGPAGVNNYLVPHVLRHVRDVDIILVEPGPKKNE